MITRRYEDELVSDFHRRVWPVIDVRSRVERAALAVEHPEPAGRRSA